MTEAKKPLPDYRLPKSVLRWVGVGLVLSTSVVAIITIFSGVTWSDLERLGYLTFGLAAVASVARLLFQCLRFRVITVGITGDSKLDLRGLAIARLASEFIAISTPSEIGGPILRAAWLSGKGIEGGKALWIGYFEVLVQIYVGAGLGLIAAAYAFSRGALVLGSTIAVVAIILIVVYTLVFVLPAVKTIKVPHRLFGIASYLVGGPRATALYVRVIVSSLNFSISARAIMNAKTLPMLIKVVGLTILEDLFAGVSLWLVLNAAGLKIDLFSATFAVFGAMTVAAIPISIGGSGVMELTMQSYLTSVYGFSSWAAVVLWRIASYQAVLAVTGIAFLLLTRMATGSKKTDLIQGEEPLHETSDSHPSAPGSFHRGDPAIEPSTSEA